MLLRSLARLGASAIALAAAAALAACSGGSSRPAAPATARQAISRLLTSAELPDGIRTIDSPTSSAMPGGLPFTQEDCTNLVDGPAFFTHNGPQPLIYAVQELTKPAPPNAADPEVQSWPGDEALIVYRGHGAQQAMTGVAEAVRRCGPAQNVNTNGIDATLRTHLSTIPGIGDLTLDVQVRTQVSSALPLVWDWIVTRSGNALLVVYAGPTIETQYLLPVARAAWKAYSLPTP